MERSRPAPRGIVRRLAGPVVLAGLSACSLVTEFKGLSGASIASGGGEGGTDASTSDGSVLSDGGTSVTDGSGVSILDGGFDASGRFCDQVLPKPTFCADFDGPGEDGGPGAEWEQVNAAAGGTFLLDTVNVLSPPRALRTTTTQGNSLFLGQSFSPATRSIKADLDFMLPQAPATGAVAVFGINQASVNVIFYANVTTAYFQISGGGAPAFSGKAGTLKASVWHHLSFDIGIVTGTITGTFDGASLWAAHTMEYPLTPFDGFTVFAGLPYLYMENDTTSLVDNVVVSVQ